MNEVLIVGTALHNLQHGTREALTIWLSLVALVLLGCGLLSASSRPRRVRPVNRATRRTRSVAGAGRAPASTGGRPAPGRPRDDAGDARRYAEEVAVAARRAELAAERYRQEWQATFNAKEAAWRAFDTADRAARQAIRAAAFPLLPGSMTADEAKDRERYLHRAATAAYHRGELGIEQLSAAILHLDGWNPHRHPFEQDLILRRAGRDRLLQRYRAVADIEHTAWQEATDAALAWQSLSQEALAATGRAGQSPIAPAASTQPNKPRVRVRADLALR
jgi:hypothetical protein